MARPGAHTIEVGRAFLGLGLVSFGGPSAHIGYFRAAFVERRGWLSDPDFASLVALCQLLPGPASSQLGMAIGYRRAGPAGLIAAWIGFTLPSALLMAAFAAGLGPVVARLGPGVLTGFAAAAVAVVALAARSMAESLAATRATALIAAAALVASLFPLGLAGPVLVILAGGLAGLLTAAPVPMPAETIAGTRVSPALALVSALLLAGLLAGLPLLAALTGNGLVGLADIFVRAGALVFGGGHVVLPLLENALVGPGLIDHATFLAGYGLAQIVPGPLFTLATYLGWEIAGPAGGLIATLAVFLPAGLVLLAALPVRDRLARAPRFGALLSGVDAAVVGLVAAVPLRTLASGSLSDPRALAILVLTVVALARLRLPVWGVVPAAGLLGALLFRAG